MQIQVDATNSKQVRVFPRTGFLGFTIDLSAEGVTSREFQCRFAVTYSFPVFIDWGDGSPVEEYINKYGDNSPTHTYKQEDGDRFDITVTSENGTLPALFVYGSDDVSRYAVVNVWNATYKQQGSSASLFKGLPNLCAFDPTFFQLNPDVHWDVVFYGNSKLEFELTRDFFQHYTRKSVSDAFRYCDNIYGIIPELLSNFTQIYGLFERCSKLIGDMPTIPTGITGIQLQHTFYGCRNITGQISALPQGITSLSNTFTNCNNIEGGIPEIPTGVTNLSSAFTNCYKLTGPIPTLPSGVVDIYSAFAGCSKLTGNVPEIPSTVHNLGSTFYGCSGLDGHICSSIPSGITSAYRAFRDCRNLTGNFPVLPSAFAGEKVGLSEVFYNCWNLSGSLPALPNNVGSLSGTFYNCSSATGSTPALPSTVNNTASTFYGCTGLDGTIGTIANNISASFTYTFYNCSKLTGPAPELWDSSKYPNIVQPTTRNYCFYNCTGLSNYDDIPALWK